MCIYKYYVFLHCGHSFFSPRPLRNCAAARAASTSSAANAPSSPSSPRHSSSSSVVSAYSSASSSATSQTQAQIQTQQQRKCPGPVAHPFRTYRLETLCDACMARRNKQLVGTLDCTLAVEVPENKWRVTYVHPRAAEGEGEAAQTVESGEAVDRDADPSQQQQDHDTALSKMPPQPVDLRTLQAASGGMKTRDPVQGRALTQEDLDKQREQWEAEQKRRKELEKTQQEQQRDENTASQQADEKCTNARSSLGAESLSARRPSIASLSSRSVFDTVRSNISSSLSNTFANTKHDASTTATTSATASHVGTITDLDSGIITTLDSPQSASTPFTPQSPRTPKSSQGDIHTGWTPRELPQKQTTPMPMPMPMPMPTKGAAAQQEGAGANWWASSRASIANFKGWSGGKG